MKLSIFFICSIIIFGFSINFIKSTYNQIQPQIIENHKKLTNSNKAEEIYKIYVNYKKKYNNKDWCSLNFDIPFGNEKINFNYILLPKYEILTRNNAHFKYSSEYYKIGYYWYSKSKNDYKYNIPSEKYYSSFNISLYNREKQKSTTIAKIFIDEEKQTIDILNDDENINTREIIHLAIDYIINQCKNK